MQLCWHLKRGSYEERCKEAKLLTVGETLDEEDMSQAWRILAGKDKVDRTKLWTLKAKVTDRGRAPRARAGYQEIVETNLSKDCRRNSFMVRNPEEGEQTA